MLAAAAVRFPLHHNNHQQLRFFARWVPYKPQQKPKHHRKLLTLKTLKSQLESSIFISPFTCHGFSAPQFKSIKHPLPKPTSKLIVTKNSLALRAFKGTQWEKLGDCMKGMNALLFGFGVDGGKGEEGKGGSEKTKVK
ncbi:Large ribosomal subunit protein uL10c-like protein [Drosera capensis]